LTDIRAIGRASGTCEFEIAERLLQNEYRGPAAATIAAAAGGNDPCNLVLLEVNAFKQPRFVGLSMSPFVRIQLPWKDREQFGATLDSQLGYVLQLNLPSLGETLKPLRQN
jgi:hypothetical protein